MPEMASHKCLDGKSANGTNLLDNHQWSRYFGDLPWATSPCGQIYWESVVHANAIQALANRNATWALSDGFWLSQRSLNNIFSWGSRKNFLTFWSSLSFSLVLLLYLEAWRGTNMLAVFHPFQWDNIWPWKAGISFPLYDLKLYLTNKNQDLWPSSYISKYRHNKN